MNCPICDNLTKVDMTTPAQRRADRRTYRLRRCTSPSCGATFTTLECNIKDVPGTQAYNRSSGPDASSHVAVPMASPPPVLYDLESELEKGLPHAVEYMIDAVRPGTNPDRTKVEAAKWLIDDRRRWRVQMAEQANRSGETPSDPAMAQLASVLRLVPDEAI